MSLYKTRIEKLYMEQYIHRYMKGIYCLKTVHLKMKRKRYERDGFYLPQEWGNRSALVITPFTDECWDVFTSSFCYPVSNYDRHIFRTNLACVIFA